MAKFKIGSNPPKHKAHCGCFRCTKSGFTGKHSLETKLKMSKSNDAKGEKNGKWKGDKVGYIPLHIWVRRWLGVPKECVYCGNEEHLQWASISHKAKRDLDDYIPLCSKCHYHYDKNPLGLLTQNRSDFYNRWSGKWEERSVN